MSYTLKAPLPGTILAVKVDEGQSVSMDDVAILLEAMKMENEIAAGYDGTIKKILVTAGQNVKMGEELIEFE